MEIFLKKHVPNAIQLLVVPITTIVVTGVLALGIIGPVTRHIGDLLTVGLVGVYETVPVVGAVLFGALYAPLVITGMHHMFIAIDLQLIAQHGGTFIWPMIALSNIAQGSAALAMLRISKIKMIKYGINISHFSILRYYRTSDVWGEFTK